MILWILTTGTLFSLFLLYEIWDYWNCLGQFERIAEEKHRQKRAQAPTMRYPEIDPREIRLVETEMDRIEISEMIGEINEEWRARNCPGSEV